MKTKAQKCILEIRDSLPPLTENQIKYAQDKHTKYVALGYTKHHYCLETGDVWKADQAITKRKKYTHHNGIKLELCTSYNNGHKETYYCGVLTATKDYQIIRVICSNKYYKKGQKATFYTHEVMQHYIDLNGKIESLMKPVHGLSMCYDQWKYGSIELRTKTNRHKLRQDLWMDEIYPKKQIHPKLKRNGFKGGLHGVGRPQNLFTALLSNNLTETLWKAKQYKLASYSSGYQSRYVKDNWNSIKIALRHNYKISDPSMYFDYLNDLKALGRDLRNPHFVCLIDLNKAHLNTTKKREELRKQKKIEDRRKKITEYEPIYRKAKEKYFNLMFKSKDLVIKPLISVQDFYEEYKRFRHCIFSNEFYKQEQTLILSAMINNEPVETVRVSLKDFTIKESRGYNNKETKYNKDIINLVQSNMNQIMQIAS